MPMGITNRNFLELLLARETTPISTLASPNPLRSFLFLSLPATHAAEPIYEGKNQAGDVRAKYVSVESVREVRLEGGRIAIEWK